MLTRNDIEPDQSPPMMDRMTEISQVVNNPVFIVGAERSGTSWLQRMLLSHPEFCGGQESMFFSCFGNFVRNNVNIRGGDIGAYWSKRDTLATVRDLWVKTFAPIADENRSARMLVEKTPAHALWLPEIMLVFPNARIIHIVRDARAVVASMLAASRVAWGHGWAASTTKHAAIRWNNFVRAANDFEASAPAGVCLRIYYERLRERPFDELEALCRFLGVNADHQIISRCVELNSLDASKTDGPIPLPTPQKTYTAEPKGFIRQGAVDAWRRELTFLQKLIVWRFARKRLWLNGYSWSGLQQ